MSKELQVPLVSQHRPIIEVNTMKRCVVLSAIASSVLLMEGCGIEGTSTGEIQNKVGHTSTTRTDLRDKSVTQSSSETVIWRLKALAQLGKVDNSVFVSGKTTIGQVERKWGKPDTKIIAGEGTYATYNSKQSAFGFNSAGTIFDVRSYSALVKHLSAADIRNVLGAPTVANQFTNQENDIYQVNGTYQLQFILNTSTQRVDHVNVFDSGAVRPDTTTSTASNTSSTPIRGIIEGFYYAPWTQQERLDMFHFMKTVGLNTYVYAPKDDPYQRAQWGVLYPKELLKQMKALVAAAKSDGIQFIYSMSPGIPAPLPGQKLTSQMVSQSITYSSAADRSKLESKIGQLESIGVHTFMLSFDDIATMLKPVDQKLYGSMYPRAQMHLANQILQDERKRHGEFELWFTPTSYYGLVDGPYWQTLRSTLNPSIQAIWTGKWVINKTITTEQAEEITRLYGRKPILWDNYPVNDYTYDVNQSHQLMMGPLQGRDATLLSHLSGFISNPMLQEDSSKLALHTIADYLQNPATYKPVPAWNEAIQNMPGITNPGLFKRFADYSSVSELNPAGYTPIGSMISAYSNAPSTQQRQSAERTLKTEFETLASLPNTLPLTIVDKELLREIQPWLTKLGEEGKGGIDALKEINQQSQANEQALVGQLNKVNALPYSIGGDIVTFMQKVASQHRGS